MPAALQYPAALFERWPRSPAAYRMTVDDKTFEYDGFTAVGANSGYYGKACTSLPVPTSATGFSKWCYWAPGGAHYISRLLSVYGGYAHALPGGRHNPRSSCNHRRARDRECGDGEPLAGLPSTVQVTSRWLPVLLG